MSFVTGIWNGIKKDISAMGKDGTYGKDNVEKMTSLVGAHRPIGVDAKDYSPEVKELMSSSPTMKNTSILSFKRAGVMAGTGAVIGAATGGLSADKGDTGKGIVGGALGGAIALGGIKAGIGYSRSQNHLMNKSNMLLGKI